MWEIETRSWPAEGNQVIGVIQRDDGHDEVAWWTRTADGWYVSDRRGNLGSRDAMTAQKSKGPHYWIGAPSSAFGNLKI